MALSDLFLRRRKDDPEADADAAKAPAHPTKALKKFLSTLGAHPQPTLLDIGPVVGHNVTFFGERARMPGGPAMLAQQTGALLLPVTLWYDGASGMRGRVHPPIPVPETGTRAEKTAAMTQALADGFATGIAAHPEDWHMLQRLWLADLPARAAKTVRALANQFALSGTEGLENPTIFQTPDVVRAGGLPALKLVGKPADVLMETKYRMFAA